MCGLVLVGQVACRCRRYASRRCRTGWCQQDDLVAEVEASVVVVGEFHLA
jgi:hypothetical protein